MFTERLTKFLKKKHDFCAVLGLGIGSGSNVIKIYKQHTTLLRNPYSYVKTVQNVSCTKADIKKYRLEGAHFLYFTFIFPGGGIGRGGM